MQCNFTDPWTEVDGERSSIKTTHPVLSDPAVRQALSLLVDRAAVQEEIYGRGGQTSANFLNAPSRFFSKNTRWEFSVDKANQVLDAAGWKRGADGIRAKDGKRLKFLFQTVDQRPAPEEPGHREAGGGQGGHRASSSSRWSPRSSSPPTRRTRTPTRTSTRICRCTTRR